MAIEELQNTSLWPFSCFAAVKAVGCSRRVRLRVKHREDDSDEVLSVMAGSKRRARRVQFRGTAVGSVRGTQSHWQLQCAGTSLSLAFGVAVFTQQSERFSFVLLEPEAPAAES